MKRAAPQDVAPGAASHPMGSGPAAPPIHRTPMAPQPWGRLGPLSWTLRRLLGREHRLADVDGPARGAGRRRRLLLLALSLGPALFATYVLNGMLPRIVTANESIDTAIAWSEGALLLVFALLTCWLAAGFWTGIMGFFTLARGGDQHLISRSAAGEESSNEAASPSNNARTAIVMPICNEDVRRAFAGRADPSPRVVYWSAPEDHACESRPRSPTPTGAPSPRRRKPPRRPASTPS